jgi:ABC-type Na+ efflux pump permease subunit
MYPVPVLGAPFRESSGVALFNRLIYGNETLDQVIPFAGELFLNFHLLGVIAGYGLLGLAIAVLQHRFSCAGQSLDAYVFFFVALWLSSLIFSSVAAVSQIFIYMMWPLYGYVFVKRCSATSHRRVSRQRTSVLALAPRAGA